MRAVLTGVPGWTVCAETDAGLDAVHETCALAPDVVVLGVDVPVLDRLAVAKRVRGAAPVAEIVLATARTSPQLVAEGMRIGVRAMILKSDTEGTLIDAVTAASRHEKYLSGSVPEYTVDQLSTERLSPRELAVARLVAAGRANKEVAGMLGITVKTAETYRTRAMRKLGAHSVVDLVLEAVRLGLVDIDASRAVDADP